MGQPIAIVDAFADRAFAGNPAAVCLMPSPRDSEWMQQVAAEMNLSETAFLVPRADPVADGYDLRWFTPAQEVDLCGHATLASAHLLWSEDHLPPAAEARFHTRSGLLTATRADHWITLDFPADPPVAVDMPAGLAEALGAAPHWVGRGRAYLIAELDTAAAVRGLTPDIGALAEVDAFGVIVTAAGDGAYDLVSRFFAPRAGIDEDPVTGSAHCVLAPYWADKLGRETLTAFQASARGGAVKLAVAGSRVRLSGQAVTVLQGQLL